MMTSLPLVEYMIQKQFVGNKNKKKGKKTK